MTKTPFVLIAVLALGIAGCAGDNAGTGSTSNASKAEALSAITAAKNAAAQANALHFEWNTTGKLIKKAEAAQSKGDYGLATKLAHKAQREGELAQQQALGQRNATGPRTY